MPKPRIGVTTSRTTHDGVAVEATNRSYLDAITAAGGLPIVLPIVGDDDVPDLLAGLDGVLLPGGGDVEPMAYGAARRLETGGVDPDRDRFELTLVHAARTSKLPILGICRGMQLLNVAFGGTLVQHLPHVTDGEHRDRDRSHEPVHGAVVASGSRLASVVGAGELGVNTLHHQAVDRVGAGLHVVARASDDQVIEAVETHAGRPVLGVQWHPELLTDRPRHAALFTWLVTTAAAGATDDRTCPLGARPAASVSIGLPHGPAYVAAVDEHVTTLTPTVA